jgi:hypothetical protein
LANYIKRQPDKNFVIVSQNPMSLFSFIATYDHLFTKENLPQIRKSYQEGSFAVQNVQIVKACPLPEELTDQESVLVSDARTGPCPSFEQSPAEKRVQIDSLIDTGTTYAVFNDELCNAFPLEKYSRVTDNKFDIPSLSDKDFCVSFLKKE